MEKQTAVLVSWWVHLLVIAPFLLHVGYETANGRALNINMGYFALFLGGISLVYFVVRLVRHYFGMQTKEVADDIKSEF